MIDELENVEVFPALTEAIRLVVDNHVGIGSGRAHITICDNVNVDKTSLLPDEINIHLPDININIIDGNRPRFKVILGLDGFSTPNGETATACWMNSRYADLFCYYPDEAFPSVYIDDIEEVAAFVSYYMRLFGYEREEDFIINKTFTLQKSDRDKVVVPDDIIIPNTLRRAMGALRKWGINSDDDLMISLTPSEDSENSQRCDFFIYFDGDKVNLSWENFFDEDRFEILKRYRNYAMLDVLFMGDKYLECGSLTTTDVDYAMRFMTDYYLHFIGDDADALSVECNFSWMIIDDDYDMDDGDDPGDFFIYRFNADGTESTPARLECCMKILERFRQDL